MKVLFRQLLLSMIVLKGIVQKHCIWKCYDIHLKKYIIFFTTVGMNCLGQAFFSNIRIWWHIKYKNDFQKYIFIFTMENGFCAHFFPLLNQINDFHPWSLLSLVFHTQQDVHVYKQMNYNSCHVNIKIKVASSANWNAWVRHHSR